MAKWRNSDYSRNLNNFDQFLLKKLLTSLTRAFFIFLIKQFYILIFLQLSFYFKLNSHGGH